MLRKLLADRFNLTFHRETKELAIYELTVAKNGPKLKESTLSPDASPEGPPPLVFVISPGAARLPARYASMAELASVLQRAALIAPLWTEQGFRDITISTWSFRPMRVSSAAHCPKGGDAAGPTLFTAVQEQLGLKLQATKGPVNFLVIEKIERPSEN